MYDTQVGDSLNYGQGMQPAKTSSTPSYMQYQMNQYGPTRKTQQQPQPPQQGQPVMPNGQPPVAQWQPTQQQTGTQGSVDQQGVYHAGTAPQAYYNPQNIQQFQGPDTGNIPYLQQQGVENLMQNPNTLSPEVVSQMKGKLRNQAVLMNQQNIGDIRAQLASRGVNPGVGYGMGQINQANAGMNQNLLGQYQNLDVQAALQNKQDQIQALNVGNEYQNSALARAVQGYGAGLQGQQAAGQEQQNMINSLMQNYQMGQQAQGLQSQSQLAAAGNQNQATSIANQMRLGQASQDLANQQFQYGQTQDTFKNDLANRQFTQAGHQFDVSSGLQGQSLSNEMQRFNTSFGLQQNQFDWQKNNDLYARQQQADAIARQNAANAQAQQNWVDQQTQNYMNQNSPDFDSLMSYLMGGGQ